MLTQLNNPNPTAHEIKAYEELKWPTTKPCRASNEPERLALPSPLPSLVSAESALGGLLWLVHREPGKCDTSLLPIVPLPFAAEDIQMSAQDPSFNQAPVNVVRVWTRVTS